MTTTINLKSGDAEESVNMGRILGKHLGGGCGVLFAGDLGTGKTTMIAGICESLGVKQKVKSPTFVLAWLYEGNFPIYHIDLYRLGDYDELENIGWEEMVEDTKIYLVEWADRFDLPYTDKAVRMSLDYGENLTERIFKLSFDEKIYPQLESELSDYVDTGN